MMAMYLFFFAIAIKSIIVVILIITNINKQRSNKWPL